ncbi:hypothetical protein Syun_027784 [Stephania yunnanensis]|uniref:Nuclease associated modular domain-containing protein n=1 Tax=Stephania yunnanensis TaxID=152371 RepID=A0AAP0ENH3_9MAGN
MNDNHLQPTQCNHPRSLQSSSHMFPIPKCFLTIYSSGALQTCIKARGSSKTARCIRPQETAKSLQDQVPDKEFRIDNCAEYSNRPNIHDKEIERRRKIGRANKGKVPWNKGITHSSETCKRIKQRTIEALRDPKIRKKMSERPHSHSEEIKAKIGMAQKTKWRIRLKAIRLREKFYALWAHTIAESARIGACGEQELHWDSYEKMKAEISLQQLLQVAEKVKVKGAAKLRAVKEKEEKRALRAKLREEKKEKTNYKKVVKRKSGINSKQVTEESSTHGLKLKARIRKIRWTKSMDGWIHCQEGKTNGHQSAIEKLDLEFIRREKLRREVSLADQIETAKKKRAKYAAKEAQTSSSSSSPTDGNKVHLLD